MAPKRRSAIWLGIALVVAAGIYPPWTGRYSYNWIFARSTGSVHVDFTRLLIEWILVGIVVAGLCAAPFSLSWPTLPWRRKSRPRQQPIYDAVWRARPLPPLPPRPRTYTISIIGGAIILAFGSLAFVSGVFQDNRPGVTTAKDSAPPPLSEPPSFAPEQLTAVPAEKPKVWAVEDPKPKIFTLVPNKPAHPQPPPCHRPKLDPNGSPWPTASAYLPGFDQVDEGGLSSLTIDNSKSDSDALVKVLSRRTDPPTQIREFFVRARGKFTAKTILAGTYAVRYVDLDSCVAFESEEIRFFATTKSEGDGAVTDYNNKTLTLYKVSNPKAAIDFKTITLDQF